MLDFDSKFAAGLVFAFRFAKPQIRSLGEFRLVGLYLM